MEEKKMTAYDMYMFAWSVLNDETCLGRARMTEEEEKAVEVTMEYLSKRYMDRAITALRCGTKKDDPVLEFTSDVLRQRMMAFNEHLKREPKENKNK